MRIDLLGDMSESSPKQSSLAPWEVAMIDSFVRAAGLIGLPRSIGEIYGCLYCSTEPLSFDEIAGRLDISRGSVSGGLKTLRQLGAIKLHYVVGSRRDHFEPELSMERLVRGFIKDQFTPHLESSAERLDAVEDQLAEEPDPARRAHGLQRLNTLRSWRRRAERLLPLALAVLAGGRALLSREEPNPASIV
ncbi:MAG: GbsR/MarR family transcriptional regulator [Opitutales bacterium]